MIPKPTGSLLVLTIQLGASHARASARFPGAKKQPNIVTTAKITNDTALVAWCAGISAAAVIRWRKEMTKHP